MHRKSNNKIPHESLGRKSKSQNCNSGSLSNGDFNSKNMILSKLKKEFLFINVRIVALIRIATTSDNIENIRRAITFLRRYELRKLINRIDDRLRVDSMIQKINEAYQIWIAENEPNSSELERQRKDAKKFDYRPLISIITPVYNTPPEILRATIQSILAQTYDNWEACFVDGNSDNPQTKSMLEEISHSDKRVHVRFLEKNMGISGNSNEALRLARGEFIALLDHDDMLAPSALCEVVRNLKKNPRLDFIYSDMDIISEDGKNRMSPLFKPDWSPELMFSANFLIHFAVIRKTLFDQFGGFRPDTDGAQDWDLFFRIVEKTRKICHIPRILYHWRKSLSSVASDSNQKPYAFNAQRLAIQSHLKRRGLRGSVFFNKFKYLQVKWEISGKNRISVIILGKRKETLEHCIESILNRTSYGNYEIIVVDMINMGVTMPAFSKRISIHPQVKIIEYDNQLRSYSLAYNRGASSANGNILLFLDDVRSVEPEWLEELVGWIEQSEVGIVGAKILYPNGRIYHGGMVIGLEGVAGNLFAGAYEGLWGIIGSTEWYRNCLAVTKCLMVSKELFDSMGGFDERFEEFGFDIDLCLRIREKGYRSVYTPFAKLEYIGPKSQNYLLHKKDIRILYNQWLRYFTNGDPYYNPNLSIWSPIPDFKKSDEKRSLDFIVEFLKNKTEIPPSKDLQPPAMSNKSLLLNAPLIKSINKYINVIHHYRWNILLKRARFRISGIRNPWSLYSIDATRLVESYDFSTRDLQINMNLQRKSSRKLDIQSINWFIPDFENPFYAGIYTILRFANFFLKKNIQNRFIVTQNMPAKNISILISKAFPNLINCPIVSLRPTDIFENIEESDVSIATLWTTCYPLLKFNKTKRKFYFIQDYEPLFYPAGSTFAQVEETYRFGFYGIANTISLKKIYKKKYGGIAEYFTPCVDTIFFYPTQETKVTEKPFCVYFYGRPGHPRNGFEIGAAALKQLKKKYGNRVRIVSAGANWNPTDFGLEGVIENLGLLDYRDTASLYRICDVGLVMSFTRHPSYLPFELMASGCVVVSNYNHATSWLLRDGVNCFLSHASPSCLCETIEKTLINTEIRKKIAANALSTIQKSYSDWDREMEKIYQFMKNPK
jgi:GT2 family glycosyltransferase